eukprot:scaffold77778_cov54-Cyclotella_meneghiniana.AAC.7
MEKEGVTGLFKGLTPKIIVVGPKLSSHRDGGIKWNSQEIPCSSLDVTVHARPDRQQATGNRQLYDWQAHARQLSHSLDDC